MRASCIGIHLHTQSECQSQVQLSIISLNNNPFNHNHSAISSLHSPRINPTPSPAHPAFRAHQPSHPNQRATSQSSTPEAVHNLLKIIRPVTMSRTPLSHPRLQLLAYSSANPWLAPPNIPGHSLRSHQRPAAPAQRRTTWKPEGGAGGGQG